MNIRLVQTWTHSAPILSVLVLDDADAAARFVNAFAEEVAELQSLRLSYDSRPWFADMTFAHEPGAPAAIGVFVFCRPMPMAAWDQTLEQLTAAAKRAAERA